MQTATCQRECLTALEGEEREAGSRELPGRPQHLPQALTSSDETEAVRASWLSMYRRGGWETELTHVNKTHGVSLRTLNGGTHL